MIYKLDPQQENMLLSLPETGMGYQIIEAQHKNVYAAKAYIVLNAEIVIDIDDQTDHFIDVARQEGFGTIKDQLEIIHLSHIVRPDTSNLIEEPGQPYGSAIHNPEERADGHEVFVRLSAYRDDKRIDRVRARLRNGSFTTTLADYQLCKSSGAEPGNRYALPNDEEIKWSFFIKPLLSDVLQRGIVQPAHHKTGGGSEAYFLNGTSDGTFVKEGKY